MIFVELINKEGFNIVKLFHLLKIMCRDIWFDYNKLKDEEEELW
ncbi:hypothetical protein HMPREF3037_00724 [Candidatus Stoquefichus sp. KLE1796]|nr:hypothetical protein HMPREF3037_00724 [Candidatus Stoquefichus sp. KLE1796]